MAARSDHAFVLNDPSLFQQPGVFDGYAAVITPEDSYGQAFQATRVPMIQVSSAHELRDGYIISVQPDTSSIRTVFRPESPHNTLFVTERCNSNCLMCSQPPKDINDSYLIEENLRIISLISLIKKPPAVLGITGGEPTLLGDDLIRLLGTLKTKLPHTHIHMLTNGRFYRDASFTRKLADVAHLSFVSAIPLYADVAEIHDYIVQAHGAFDQTVEGLYNAAEAGLNIEIRVVLHKQSIPRLRQLAEYIYWNFPFAGHVAFMGLEHMGYVKKNWEALWIDPYDYMSNLEHAVRYLYLRRMNVSIYNLQLCLLPKTLWAFARKSISDYKNIYLDVCTDCSEKEHCSGFFLSQQQRHSNHIRAL